MGRGFAGRNLHDEPAITSAGSGDRVVFAGNITLAADLPAVQIISSPVHGAGEPCATTEAAPTITLSLWFSA